MLLMEYGLCVVCVCCVNLFDKGRAIEGRVPSQALAVAVAAGQHGDQHQRCHQPGHGGHGLPDSLDLQVAWFGPGGLYGPLVGWALAMCAPHGPTNSTGRLLHGPGATAGWDPLDCGHMVASLNLTAARDEQSGQDRAISGKWVGESDASGL